VVELGAGQYMIIFVKILQFLLFHSGAGLPSICAYMSGAQYVCCTDYPVPLVLENIRDNFNR
jgi:predicted nicotinamide N-methyase